jgi:hypothetical protein
LIAEESGIIAPKQHPMIAAALEVESMRRAAQILVALHKFWCSISAASSCGEAWDASCFIAKMLRSDESWAYAQGGGIANPEGRV